MKIISVNVNGIRAAEKKGLFHWLESQEADVVCLQEVRAQEHQYSQSSFHPEGYTSWFHNAQKKGYSGVSIYAKKQPDQLVVKLGNQEIDDEGRYLRADFGSLSVVSVYLPSGSSGDDKQAKKIRFMRFFEELMADMLASKRSFILCGDWNIAHKKIDIKNWRANQTRSGFLPEEREWMDQLFEQGWVDAFRVRNQQAEQYTWWSNRGKAWENNTGWRIDYQIVTPDLKNCISEVSVYKDERFSDHSPLIIDYVF
jgi:exodeoxyribonuclease III